MELHNFIKILYQKNTIGSFPFFWILKNNNLIVTIGKTATRTLLNVDNITSSSIETILNYETLLDLVCNKSTTIHILIRNPHSRFKSGLFENFIMEIIYDNNYDELSNESDEVINKIEVVKLWSDFELQSNLENFIKKSIQNSKNQYTSNDFHTGNWLYVVKHLQTIFGNDTVKIWKFDELKYLLRVINSKDDIIANKSDNKLFISEFLNAYSNLNDDTFKLINEYVYDDFKIWNELFKTNNKNETEYVPIFDIILK